MPISAATRARDAGCPSSPKVRRRTAACRAVSSVQRSPRACRRRSRSSGSRGLSSGRSRRGTAPPGSRGRLSSAETTPAARSPFLSIQSLETLRRRGFGVVERRKRLRTVLGVPMSRGRSRPCRVPASRASLQSWEFTVTGIFVLLREWRRSALSSGRGALAAPQRERVFAPRGAVATDRAEHGAPGSSSEAEAAPLDPGGPVSDPRRDRARRAGERGESHRSGRLAGGFERRLSRDERRARIKRPGRKEHSGIPGRAVRRSGSAQSPAAGSGLSSGTALSPCASSHISSDRQRSSALSEDGLGRRAKSGPEALSISRP